MWKKILGAVVAVLAVLAVVVAMQPAEFKIERAATYNVAPVDVFPYVNDLHLWQLWSPWAKLDPNVKNTFEGPSSGEGAVFRWVGNSAVGEGGMTIMESKPNELVRMRLEFIKPFAAVNTAEFKIQPAADKTVLTWTMYGENNFVGKAFGLFMNMDKMVGASFEEGLATLRGIVETKGK